MGNDLIVLRQLPVIENRLQQAKAGVEARVSFALSLACTEDTYKAVKKERADLRTEFESLEQRRIQMKKEILEPYERFLDIYNECVSDLYKDADAKLKTRIDEVENGLKEEKRGDLAAYFLEYSQKLGIPEDLADFDSCGITVRLTDSKKSLHQAAKDYLDRIASDLQLIDTLPDKDEVIVEYRVCRNVSKAVTTVNTRHQQIEDEQRRREASAEAKAARDAAEQKAAQILAEERQKSRAEALEAPVAEAVIPEPERPTEKVYEVAFRVRGSLPELKALKEFLVSGGYKYEQF